MPAKTAVASADGPEPRPVSVVGWLTTAPQWWLPTDAAKTAQPSITNTTNTARSITTSTFRIQ